MNQPNESSDTSNWETGETTQGGAEPEPIPEAIGRYQVEDLLGEGGFGRVFLARDEMLSRAVAIKVPHRERMKNPKDVNLFMEEARAAASLDHPAIVPVFDVGQTEEGVCFVVSKLIEGVNLKEKIFQARLSTYESTRLIAILADALHHAHRRGLVHRDIKPANLLIDREGNPHITDFGLAIKRHDVTTGPVRAGTPAYMSPEQAAYKGHQVDGRTDLWSLGVILYELITAKRPFVGGNTEELFDRILNSIPTSPCEINSDLPKTLEQICLQCLAKAPEDRYTTGAELAVDLRSVLHSLSKDEPDSSDNPYELFSQEKSEGLEQTQVWQRTGGNLPVTPNRFVGREKELKELTDLVNDPQVRLITLTGHGGIGKTRLAIQFAGSVKTQFASGCWLVDVSKCSTIAGIAQQVASALGVPLTGNDPPEKVVANILEFHKPLLLILDSFEQALDAAEATLNRWRQQAPHVLFLVTSQALLGLTGERGYELGPLTSPSRPNQKRPNIDRLLKYESVQLFVERAKEAQPNFTLDASNSKAIAEICAELDGLPLALELAAARIAVLKPEQIANKLEVKFDFLKSSRRDLASRQQTLLGVLDWSYELLSEEERDIFLQAGAFRNGFFLDAAEAVLQPKHSTHRMSVLDVLQSLHEKSLLRVVDSQYETRFRMYRLIREYAEHKWQLENWNSYETQYNLSKRLAEYIASYAEEWNAKLHSTFAVEALNRVQLETENLLAAYEWAMNAEEFPLAARVLLALTPTLNARGPFDQRVSRLEQTLKKLEDSKLQTLLKIALAETCQSEGNWQSAKQYALEAVESAEQLEDTSITGKALTQLGSVQQLQGDFQSALTSFEEAEAIAQTVQDESAVAQNIHHSGLVHIDLSEFDQALDCFDRSAEIARQLDDFLLVAHNVLKRGTVLRERGDFDKALKCFDESEEIARRFNNPREIARNINNRGNALADRGEYDRAIECYRQSEAIGRELGDLRFVTSNVLNRGIVFTELGEFDAAMACFEEAESIARTLKDQTHVAHNIYYRGVVLLRQSEKYYDAIECFVESMHIFDQLGEKVFAADVLSSWATALYRLKDYPASREKIEQAIDIYQEIGAISSQRFFVAKTIFACIESAAENASQANLLSQEAMQLAQKLDLNAEHPNIEIREHLELLQSLTAKI